MQAWFRIIKHAVHPAQIPRNPITLQTVLLHMTIQGIITTRINRINHLHTVAMELTIIVVEVQEL